MTKSDFVDKVAAELERPYTAYRRLKLIMDYWCSLWFWPIEQSKLLPSRDVFLMDIEMILVSQDIREDCVLAFLA